MATDDLQQVSSDDSQLIISPKIGHKNRSEKHKKWSNESSIYLRSTLAELKIAEIWRTADSEKA
jgi:hypothetical protein